MQRQAVNVRLVAGSNGVTGLADSTVPFPIPGRGIEIFWNHVLRFRGSGSVKRTSVQVPVHSNGSFVPVLFETSATWGRDLSGNDNSNLLFCFMQKIKAPARLQGDILLVHEFIDQEKEPRNAWVYNPGQRRVRRAPEVAYDGPVTGSDNLSTADDLDMMNGSPNRYELWRFHEGHAMVHYQVKVPWLVAESQYDLISGRYLATAMDNEMKGYQFHWDVKGVTMGDYTPAALRRAGR